LHSKELWSLPFFHMMEKLNYLPNDLWTKLHLPPP
jgi:hypothetical protein